MLHDPDKPPEEIWRSGRLEFALRYPLSNGWRNIVGAGILVLLSTLILPALALVGYGYTVCRSAAYGKSQVPGFEDFPGLVWKDRGDANEERSDNVNPLTGFASLVLKGIGASFVVAVVVGVVAAASAGATVFVTDRFPMYEYEVSVSVAVGAPIAVGYLLPAYLTVYAATGNSLRTVVSGNPAKLLGSARYLRAWLFGTVLIASLILVGTATVPTVVGAVLWLGYAPVAVSAYWGRVYKELLDSAVVEPIDTSV